jgi:hypothetical protein
MQSSDLYVLSLPTSRVGPEAWKTFSWLLALGVPGQKSPCQVTSYFSSRIWVTVSKKLQQNRDTRGQLKKQRGRYVLLWSLAREQESPVRSAALFRQYHFPLIWLALWPLSCLLCNTSGPVCLINLQTSLPSNSNSSQAVWMKLPDIGPSFPNKRKVTVGAQIIPMFQDRNSPAFAQPTLDLDTEEAGARLYWSSWSI